MSTITKVSTKVSTEDKTNYMRILEEYQKTKDREAFIKSVEQLPLLSVRALYMSAVKEDDIKIVIMIEPYVQLSKTFIKTLYPILYDNNSRHVLQHILLNFPGIFDKRKHVYHIDSKGSYILLHMLKVHHTQDDLNELCKYGKSFNVDNVFKRVFIVSMLTLTHEYDITVGLQCAIEYRNFEVIKLLAIIDPIQYPILKCEIDRAITDKDLDMLRTLMSIKPHLYDPDNVTHCFWAKNIDHIDKCILDDTERCSDCENQKNIFEFCGRFYCTVCIDR